MKSRPNGIYAVRPRRNPPDCFPTLWFIHWGSRTASKVNMQSRVTGKPVTVSIDSSKEWKNVEVRLVCGLNLDENWDSI